MSKPRGVRNNNPGNIRVSKAKWVGQTGDDGSFVIFDTPEHGIRALTIVLLNYYKKHGLNTIYSIISRYAPANENDVVSYSISVQNTSGYGMKQITDLSNKSVMVDLINSISLHENGGHFYGRKMINAVVAEVFKEKNIK